MRNRALQAFWTKHVEAMNWGGMSVREYAAALHLSPTSLRKWRDRLDDGEVDIDWRAHLHPSARPVAGTSAKRTPSETGLTAPPSDDPSPPRQPLRRFFTDDQKRAIALETDQPGVSVSQVARKHGIVTGLLFRWRVQFGVAQRKGAKLAPVALTDDAPAILRLRDLVQPPNGMTRSTCLTVGGCSRRPASIHTPFVSRSPVTERTHDDHSGGRESAPGAGLHRYAQRLRRTPMLVQQTLK